MKNLADAWNWYVSTRRQLSLMHRLGEKYWQDLSQVDTSIWRDDRFRMLSADDIVAGTKISLQPIDDLAVVVLFSVFESKVRDFLLDLIKPEADSISDPILKDAVEDARHGVKEGSFYARVLEPLKKQRRISADLVTQIDQIRDYRNWVAHGRRRETPTNNVTPELAYARLGEFLEALGVTDDADLELPDN